MVTSQCATYKFFKYLLNIIKVIMVDLTVVNKRLHIPILTELTAIF